MNDADALVIVDALLDGPLSDPSIVAQLPGAKPLVDVVAVSLAWEQAALEKDDEAMVQAMGRWGTAIDALPPAVRDLIEGPEGAA